jgi:hypothetical protein
MLWSESPLDPAAPSSAPVRSPRLREFLPSSGAFPEIRPPGPLEASAHAFRLFAFPKWFVLYAHSRRTQARRPRGPWSTPLFPRIDHSRSTGDLHGLGIRRTVLRVVRSRRFDRGQSVARYFTDRERRIGDGFLFRGSSRCAALSDGLISPSGALASRVHTGVGFVAGSAVARCRFAHAVAPIARLTSWTQWRIF